MLQHFKNTSTIAILFNNKYYCNYYRIVRNKAADTARLSNRGTQQTELGMMSTTRPSGQTTGIALSEDEQAAAQLYAIGSLLQGGAGGGMSPLTAQQQAAVYAAGGNGSSVFVNRRTTTADDGQCQTNTIIVLIARNSLRKGIFVRSFSSTSFPSHFPSLSTPRSGLLNPAKGFGGVLLASPAGQQRQFAAPDTFYGLKIHQKCVCGGATATNTFLMYYSPANVSDGCHVVLFLLNET